MEKVNWKILNAALWFEIVLAYFLPFEVTNDFQYQIGFPMSFLAVYDTKIGKSPFDSMHVNPIGFLIDVRIIYLVILLCVKGYKKWKCRFWRKRQ